MDKNLQKKFWGIVTKHPLQDPIQILPPAMTKPFDLESVFAHLDNVTEFEIELGIGWGEVAIKRAEQNPNTGYIGFELKWDRVRSVMREIEKRGIPNLRICQLNLSWFYADLFEPNSLHAVHIYFPDPWPKRKHRKHRLMTPNFLKTTYRFLKPGGRLLFATDYSPYARRVIHMMREPSFLDPDLWPSTYPFPHYKRSSTPVIGSRFESMQMEEGYRPFYMEYEKP